MALGIITADDFLQKVKNDLSALADDTKNPVLAINAAVFTYHLHEWIWAKKIKPNHPKEAINPNDGCKEQVQGLGEYQAWLDRVCPHFRLVQALCNGSKHAAVVRQELNAGGFDDTPWDAAQWDEDCLLIDLGEDDNSKDRYVLASEIIAQAGAFMVAHAEAHPAG